MIETIDIISIIIAKQLLLNKTCDNCNSVCANKEYNTCLEWREEIEYGNY